MGSTHESQLVLYFSQLKEIHVIDRLWPVAPCALVLLLLAGRPAVGAEGVEELLPANTQQFLILHVQQLTASEAYKKHAAETVKDLLARDEVKDLLAKGGIDPLKDIDRVVFASPAPFNPAKAEGMIVLCGTFNTTKLAFTALGAALKYKDHVAIVKDGPYRLVKLTGGDLLLKQECFAAVVDAKRIIVASKQEDVRAALDRAADKKPPVVKDKALLKAFADVDPKVSLVGRLDRGQLRLLWGVDDPVAAKMIAKVNFGTMEVRVTSDIKFTITVEMGDMASVKTMRAAVVQFGGQVQTLTSLLALTDPRAKPLADAARSLQVSTKGRTVTLTGRAPAELLAVLAKLVGQ